MNLEQFAKKAGVTLSECDPKLWGGRVAYQEADTPNCAVCGFRTESAAYKHWLSATFGKSTAKAVLGLLRRA
jgi:hypothetical protein